MKKQILTTAIILGLALTTFADPNARGGLFMRGHTPEQSLTRNGADGPMMPALPNHNQSGNQNADAPLGTGIAVLLSLGAAYLATKKHKED